MRRILGKQKWKIIIGSIPMHDKVANELLEKLIHLNHRLERLEWGLAEVAKILRQLKEDSSDD